MTKLQIQARRAMTAVTLVSLVAAPVALASRNSIGKHKVVDKKGANVRKAASDGSRTSQYIGHLKKGDQFTVTKHDGSFCFGKAAGNVDHKGWVLCGALSK